MAPTYAPFPAAVSDDALLAGLAAGDRDAARVFVDRHQRRVYGLALRMLGDRVAAEDVAQETFLRAWRNAATFDARRGRVTTWLLRITHNLAIDTLRLRTPEPFDPTVLTSLDVASKSTTVEDAAVVADLTTRVRTCLARLPAEQARALLLAAFHGRTAHEISLAENIPLGTAKTRIRTALIKLRDMLRAEQLSWSDATS